MKKQKPEYRYGTLVYNFQWSRLDIKFDDGEVYNGLHCGQCIEVKICGKWLFTSVEMKNDWYLTGIPGSVSDLLGYRVRKDLNIR